MAKKFFYVCAGLLMLAVAASVALRGTPPLGAATQLATPTEAAVLTGILQHGETIPLPIYRDGAQATEAECAWTVSPEYVNLGSGTEPLFLCYASATVGGPPSARGRVVTCYVPIGGSGAPNGNVNYMIVATRDAALGATGTHQATWGALKVNGR